MAQQAAAGVAASELGSYQQAVRLVLTHDVITGSRPRPGVLDQVLRWADQMTGDFRELLGYTLIATTRQVRLSRRLDGLDPTQGTMFAKNVRPFDRRRLAYLCLVLASFQRSRVLRTAVLRPAVLRTADGELGVPSAPWQVLHGSSTMRPAPPQRGQVRSMVKKPWLARTRPAPPQLAQAVGLAPGAQPEPEQSSQVSAAGTLISASAPA